MSQAPTRGTSYRTSLCAEKIEGRFTRAVDAVPAAPLRLDHRRTPPIFGRESENGLGKLEDSESRIYSADKEYFGYPLHLEPAFRSYVLAQTTRVL